MAGNGDIRQRIVLEGEKEYSSALKEAQRNLKVLRSELKAETAELGANATAQQKNETRVKNLQKQIKEQEKVVKTYEKALAEVREKYGDNEEAIAKWEIKLNEARSTLANMRNGLDETSQSMKSVASSADMGVVAANSFADSLGKIAEVGNTISASIEGVFTGVVGVISDAISALWDQLMDVAARANQWGDIAGYWNTSASNIQKWYHAVQGTYNDFSALSNAVTRIVTGDQQKIAEASGVSAEQYSDKWEYAMAVMDSLGSMDYEKRLEAVGEIFGEKRSPQILDLLNDWAKIQANLADFDATNGGYGLTDEQLQNASDLAESVAKIEQSWQALKDMASIELFGDLALNLTGNVQSILDAFKDYFQADNDADRQAALDKVKNQVTEAFQSIRSAFEDGIKMLGELANELQNSDDPYVKAFGTVLDKLVGVLEWFADPANWGAVKAGFAAIIGVWATGEAATAIGKLSSFASHILTIYKWWTGQGTWTGTPTIPTTIPNTNPTGVTKPKGTTDLFGNDTIKTTVGSVLLSRVAQTAGSAAFSLASLDPTGAVSLLPEVFLDKTAAGQALRRGEGVSGAAAAGAEEVKNAALQAIDNWNTYLFKQLPEAIWGIFGIDKNTLQDAADALQEASEWTFGDEYTADDIMQMIENGTPGVVNDVDSGWWDDNDGWSRLPSDSVRGLTTLPEGVKEAIKSGMGSVKVVMDGQVVGNLVAPYVSEQIAREVG